MKLYHGTSSKYLDEILKNGLVPRRNKKGNWAHTVASHKDAVYLTSVYPWHFALAASKNDEAGIIVEVETFGLDTSKLHPDEDVLEQAGRHYDNIKGDMKTRTQHYRKIARHNPNWEISLRAMGTCAYYGDISPLAITKVVKLDWNKMDISAKMMCGDSVPSLLSYKILENRHRALTDWLCDNREVTADELTEVHRLDRSLMPEEMAKMYDEREKHFLKVMTERKGISIVSTGVENGVVKYA